MTNSDVGTFAVHQLRKDCNIDVEQPIDLNDLLDLLSVKLRYKNIGNGIDGACYTRGNKRLIVLNPAIENTNRERFTLSHEIGHLLIHHEQISICRSSDFSFYSTQSTKEREANDFATELLLPHRNMTSILKKSDLDYNLIQSTANYYNVSLSVAAIRLVQLFNDVAVVIWHDGQTVTWSIRSESCFLKLIKTALPISVADRNSKKTMNAQPWLREDVEDLMCDEETVYFSNMRRYLTLLKFYQK